MSLVYVIDGYNVIKHSSFSRDPSARAACGGGISPRSGLVRLIQLKKLAGSSRNRVVIVFDGYPDASSGDQAAGSVEVVFSCSESADERIKYLVDHAASPKELIVVSDDRDVQFYARSAGAVPMAVEDFIGRADEKKRSSARRERGDASDPKLNYSQMERINKELRDRWLKGSG